VSDFLAIAAINGTVLHLVDWDKPCWFRAGSPNGERVIPHPEFFLTDALAMLAADEFGLKQEAQFPWRRDCIVYDFTDPKYESDLRTLRHLVRAKSIPFLLVSHFGNIDVLLKQDLSKLSLRVLTAQINESDEN
jgi:hypothetical protein